MVLTLCYKLLKQLAYSCVRGILGIVQTIYWTINGTYFQLWKSRQPDNYDWSAHVQTIHFRFKLDLVMEPSGPTNFISCHHSFENPRYVLTNNITLYYVTKDQAVFVETDPNVFAPHSDYGCFLRVAQFTHARRIITMPIRAFHRLAETIGDPKGKLIFVSSTARCGSTLLSQMFEETNKAVGFSEPDALNAIAFYRGRMPQPDLDRIVVSSIRVLCKPIGRPIDAYVFKTTAPTIDAVPTFTRLFPDSKQLFMYREGLPMAKSLYRAGKQMPLLEITFFATQWSQWLTLKSVEAMGLSPDMFKVKCIDGLVFCAYVWAVIVDKYLQFRKQNIDIVAVKYEDFVTYPLDAVREVFKYCGLPNDWAEEGVKAMNKDSQRQSPLSMSKLSKWEHAELTPHRKSYTDRICDQFDLPRIPETCVLDGTITNIANMAASKTK